MRTQAAFLLAALSIGSPAAADTIYLVDGSTVAEVTIQEEGLDVVTYRKGSDRGDVASDQVLAVEYESKPPLVDRADVALADELYGEALTGLEEYVAEALAAGEPPRRHPWAPAYAMYRLVEVNDSLGQHEAVVSAANQLIQHAAQSRYLPLAMLKKAEALHALEKSEEAGKALDDLGALIEGGQLSERWRHERDLAAVLFDTGLQGEARREKLAAIAEQASSPIVRNRAEVAVGESLLAEKKLAEAEEVFRTVVDDPRAADATLASAYTGLGDCLFQRGADLNAAGDDGSTVLRAALESYMRVVVVYKQQLQYVPKAMFYAARVLQQFQDDESRERARKLYLTVMRDFQGSRWADEARGFLR